MADIGYVNNGKITVRGSYEFVQMVIKIYDDIESMGTQYIPELSQRVNLYEYVTPKKLKNIVGYEKGDQNDMYKGTGWYHTSLPRNIYVREGEIYLFTARTIVHEITHLYMFAQRPAPTMEVNEKSSTLCGHIFYVYFYEHNLAN
jgi:hypothetical protein